MRVAIVGKGGVGKTTIAAALARLLAKAGRSVYAIDADPNNCLAYALGLPPAIAARIQPLSEMSDLLAERVGTRPGQGGLHIINPPVTDLIEKYTVTHDGIKLLVMGTIEKGGGGCACPENNTLRAIVRELVDLPDELVMDMEAGLEHLGRGTAQHVDALLGVVAPHASSVRTILRIRTLAQDLGLRKLLAIANRVRGPEDRALIDEMLRDVPVVVELPQYEGLESDSIFGNQAGEQLLGDLTAQLPALEAAVEKER
ncbi:MAG: ATP-binding protein [Candidatus Zipacnadales bacterium]